MYKQLQKIYKARVQTELTILKTSDQFKYIQNAFHLNDYDFIMAQPKHADPILHLVSNIYSKRNPLSKLFGIKSHHIQKMMKTRTDFVCNNGRMICAVNDKTQQIKGGALFGDYCDHPYIKTCADFHIAAEVDHLEELLTNLWADIDFNRKDVPSSLDKIVCHKHKMLNETELMMLYGEYSYGGMTFISDQRDAKLYVFLMWLYATLSARCGYRFCVAEIWHPSALRMAKAVNGDTHTILNQCNFNEMRNFIFRDGTNMNYILNKYKRSYKQKEMTGIALSLHRVSGAAKYFETVKKRFINENIL